MEGIEYSPIFKGLIAFFLSSFMPVTLLSFLLVRRTKKAVEFARVVDMLAIAEDVAEFARNRVAEQYAARDFRMPMLFAWLVAILGFVSLLFGADMVVEHEGKVNFLLTGISQADPDILQSMRVQNMAVMSLAFIGAFLWSTQCILHRLNAGDLAPSVYFNAGTRMILTPMISLMCAHLINGFEVLHGMQAGLPVIAFLVGWFPSRALIFLKEQFPLIFRSQRNADSLPLNMVEGVHTYDRARLNELGIVDAQNLANANFIELVVRTAFNPGQIIDWIGQASLYVYFKDDIVVLRKHQVRTAFDMLPVCRDAKLLAQLSADTGINALGFQLFCTKLTEDPVVEQLLSFQRHLCFSPATKLHDERLNIVETEFGGQQQISREIGHG
ncbi:MAG: hypothetical protein QNJ78_09580 [Gammaproteobacteria bacterium]|nr:hypothetical protein [Gammaproteobacteria bacterium]